MMAQETRVAAGSVSAITKNWKNDIGNYDIDELRNFAREVNKSGITIPQCTRGFRMENLLRKFGIVLEEEEEERRGNNDKHELVVNDIIDGKFNDRDWNDVLSNCGSRSEG